MKKKLQIWIEIQREMANLNVYVLEKCSDLNSIQYPNIAIC